MTQPSRSERHERGTGRDEGSALILVLVLMVVGSLIVLPLMSYVMSANRHNTVLSAKTQRDHAVRAALRVALADPAKLYQACGDTTTLASPTIGGIDVDTRCYTIDHANAQQDEDLQLGLVAAQLGATVPAELMGSRWEAPPEATTSSWLDASTVQSTEGHVWLPNLPVHALNRRASAGWQLPDGFPDCTVYFPGTYPDPVVISGPTYFASGIYYFESEVRVAADGAAVAGLGANGGCSSDQEAAFYAIDAPGTHNINGLGATWVFGDEGRLVITDGGTPSLRFNTRYVADGDVGAQPSKGVSIVSVNGDIDMADGALDVPDVLRVPMSYVGQPDPEASPVLATAQEYLPSLLTPEPRVPSAPTTVNAQSLDSAIRVTWAPPTSDNGSLVTGYVVTATRTSGSGSGSCTTVDTFDCVITGLSNDRDYAVTVVATNALGDSEPGVPSAPVRPRSSSPDVTKPGKPQTVTAEPFQDAVRVRWTAPSSDGNAPISGYTVTGTPSGSCTTSSDVTECIITGLPAAPAPGYTFRVTATNASGTSDASTASPAVQPVGDPPPPPPGPEAPPTPTPFVPDPIIDIDLTTATDAVVSIPGYVAVPQGRFRVANPGGYDVQILGGILASGFDVVDGRAAGPESIHIGLHNPIAQYTFRIVSETASGTPRMVSTAIVQVNQNGGYAINSWEIQ